jgi:hypothetical protein
MASFTEQATLKVTDKSSAQIRKINAELKKLFDTANSLKSTSITIKINDKGVQSAIRNLRSLRKEIDRLGGHGGGTSLNVRLNPTSLANMRRQLSAVHAHAAQSAVQAVRGMIPTRTGLGGVGRVGIIPVRVIGAVRIAGTWPPGGAGAGRGAGGGGGRHGAFGAGGQGLLGRLAGGVALGTLGANSLQTIGRQIGRAAVEGTKDFDVGMTSWQMKNLPAIQQAAGIYAVNELQAEGDKAGGAFLNIGQRMRRFSEAYGTARDVQAAKFLTGQMEETIRLQVALGRSFQDASDDSINFIKGLEQAGKLTFRAGDIDEAGREIKPGDSRIGNFNKVAAERQMNFLRVMIPTIGEEMTGGFYRKMATYMRGSRYAANERSMATVLLMGEEMGTTAAVGWNQMIKQLGGRGITKAINAGQIEQGWRPIIGMAPDKPGRRGRKGAKGGPIYGPTVDYDLLQKDPISWLEKHAIPKLGADIADPAKVKQFAEKVTGDRTATDALMSILFRYQENKQTLEAALGTWNADTQRFERVDEKGGIGAVRKITGQSVTAATQQLQNQFQGVVGATIMTMREPLTDMMGGVAKGMGEFARGISEGTLDPAGMLKGAMTTVPLALSAGMTAMMNPMTAPLGAAGIALSGSAAALTAAAGVLAGSSLLGMGLGGAGAAALARSPFVRRALLAARFVPGLGAAAVLGGAAYDLYNAQPGGLPEGVTQDQIISEYSKANQEYYTKYMTHRQNEYALKKAQEARRPDQKFIAVQRQMVDQLAAELKAAKERSDYYKDIIETGGTGDFGTAKNVRNWAIPTTTPPVAVPWTLGDYKPVETFPSVIAPPGGIPVGGQTPVINTDTVVVGGRGLIAAPGWTPVGDQTGYAGVPMTPTGWPGTSAVSNWVGPVVEDAMKRVFAPYLEPGPTTPTGAFPQTPVPITAPPGGLPIVIPPGAFPGAPTGTVPPAGIKPPIDSIYDFTPAKSMFDSTFQSGQTAIEGAGRTAIASIDGGASGAGSKFGDAALQKINSAVANVTITVNGLAQTAARQSDTGAQKAVT